MPSVWVEPRKNKKGLNHIVRWEIIIDGKKVRGSESCGPSSKYADTRAEEILEDLHAGRPVQPRITLITVPTFADEYLRNSKATKALNTYRNFDKPAVDAFAAWFGNKPIGMVDVNVLFAWRDKMIEEEFDGDTINMRLRALCTALNFAKLKKYILQNPYDQIERKTMLYVQVEEEERYLTQPELKRLFPLLPLRFAQAFYFILKTGLRHSELLNLDWKMIRRPKKGAWVAEITRASAHGLRTGHRTKTRKSREIEIDRHAQEVMGEPQDEGKVFPWVTRGPLQEALREAAHALEMGQVRAHDGRHTWATDFMRRTGNQFELMYRGGWATVVSMAKYQSIRRQDEPSEMKRFSHYFPTKARRAGRPKSG